MSRELLTRDQVVSAAVALLDEKGPGGLNMRALGHRLNSAPTAVYWHVGSKAALIELASDRAWGEIPLTALPVAEWRDAASRLATEAHTMLLRHPWVVELFGTIPTFSLNKARFDERSLAIYEEAGFDGAAGDHAAAAVFTYVLGNALGNAAAASLRRTAHAAGRTERESVAWDEVLRDLPRLRARLGQASAENGASPQGGFDYGLGLLLDGLESRRPPRWASISRSRGDEPVIEPHV